MKRLLVMTLVFLCLADLTFAQQGDSDQAAPKSRGKTDDAVPRLIRFNGSLQTADHKPGQAVNVTFALYGDQIGGSPLWLETQNITLDEQRHYAVLLGNATKGGLPADLFSSGDAKWLGIQVDADPEQPRVLLVSVPYAMKAAEAERIGGLAAEELVSRSQLQSELKQYAIDLQTTQATKSTAPVHESMAAAPSGQTIFAANTTNWVVSVAQSGTGTGLVAYSGALPAFYSSATGVQGNSDSTSGSGVRGNASATTGVNFGVVGTSNSGNGIGVLGSATTGTGVQGSGGLVGVAAGAIASNGRGVDASGPGYGVVASATGNGGIGVSGSANATNGTGVFGNASANNGTGIFGQSPGTGVQGTGTALNGSSTGVVGLSKSSSGVGVLAQNNAITGNTIGLKALVSSAVGTAAVLNNSAGGKVLSAQNNGAEVASISGNGDFAGQGSVSTAGNVTASGSVSGSSLSAAGALSAGSATVTAGVTAGSFSGDGSGLSNLKGSNVTGTVANATNASNASSLGGAIAANYARLDLANDFLANNHFTGAVGIDGNVTLTGNVNGQGNRSLSGFNTVSGYVGAFDRISLGTGPVGSEQAVMVGNSSQGVFNIHTANTGTAIGAGWYAGWAMTQGQYSGQGAFFTLGTDNSGTAYYFHPHSLTISTSDPTQGQIIFNTGGRDSNALVIDRSGYVGIGTGAPAQALDVAGNIRASSFIGDGSGLTNISAGTAVNAQHAVTADSATVADSSATAVLANNTSNLAGVAAANYARLDIANSFAARQDIYGNTSSGTAVVNVSQTGTGNGLSVSAPALGVFPDGAAVIGNSTDTTGASGSTIPRGVLGLAHSSGGRGVQGVSLATSGDGLGVFGVTVGDSGFGVLGQANSATGQTTGVYGLAYSNTDNAAGVLAYTDATIGRQHGLRAIVNSPDATSAFLMARDTGMLLQGMSYTGPAGTPTSITQVFGVDGLGNINATSYTGDGSRLTNITAATASSATNAQHADLADSATSAASLGGVAATNYARLDQFNTFTSNQNILGSVGIAQNLDVVQTLNVGGFYPHGQISASNNSDQVAGYFENAHDLGSHDTIYATNTGFGTTIHAINTNRARAGLFELNNPGGVAALEARAVGSGTALKASNTGGGPSAIFDQGNVGIGTLTPGFKLDVNGNVNAASFTGDGSGLTGINAATATNAAHADVADMATNAQNASQLNNLPASAYAQRGLPNTFIGDQTVNGNVNINGPGNGIVFPDGSKQTTATSSGGTGIPAGFMIMGASANPPSGYTLTGTLNTWNTWTTARAMPTSRYWPAAATLNGKVYAIGGDEGSGPSATMSVYNPVVDSWGTAMSMPTPRYGLAAATVNEKIYAIGGYNNNGIQRTVEVYDPVADSWSPATPMPTARYGLAAAVVNGKIYAIGGNDGGYGASGYLGTVEVYDPVANSWSSAMPMPTARYTLGASAVNGNIYAIGGYFIGTRLDTVEVYDPGANSWISAMPMPTARNGLAAASLNGQIYMIGGYNDASGRLNTVEVYDPAADRWSTIMPMPTARNALAACEVNGQIFAIGGVNNQGFLNVVERFASTGTLYTFTKN